MICRLWRQINATRFTGGCLLTNKKPPLRLLRLPREIHVSDSVAYFTGVARADGTGTLRDLAVHKFIMQQRSSPLPYYLFYSRG